MEKITLTKEGAIKYQFNTDNLETLKAQGWTVEDEVKAPKPPKKAGK